MSASILKKYPSSLEAILNIRDEINSSGKDLRILISGGGTGGHVFPAIAIANQLRELFPKAEIQFVGAIGKIEMVKVPQAGYPIIGLPIRGLQRRLTLKNLSVPFRLLNSLIKAFRLVRKFKPQVAIGVGGYASFPTLYAAKKLSVKTVVQEQNSFAGVANKLLRGTADKYCVAYEGMEKFFPKEKIILTGNPVRSELATVTDSIQAAKKHFGLEEDQPVIFLTGGSLGAQSMNEAFVENHALLEANPSIQWLWQVGSLYEKRYEQSPTAKLSNVKMIAFVDRMDLAYHMADVMICRAGALTVSEICLLGKAAVLVPSPNVAEDHQTKNALALVEKEAAIIVKNKEAEKKMIQSALDIYKDKSRKSKLEKNALEMGKPQATQNIALEILKLIQAE